MAHENSSPNDAPDSQRSSEDLFDLKDGAYDAELNKHVKALVMVTETFAVYVATDLSIQWRTTNEQVWSDSSGEVMNRVGLLETRSNFIADPATLAGVRRQIAEGLARSLDGQPIESSLSVLREAEFEIQARNKEVSWAWYFTAAYTVTLVSVVALVAFWLLRAPVREYIGTTAFDVVMGALCGTIGALLSVTSRGDRLVLDANAGMRIHRLEGLSRIGTGMAGAFLVALAIKSGALLGGVHFAGSQFALLLAFCVAAGASERLVPTLVTNFEETARRPMATDKKLTQRHSPGNVQAKKTRGARTNAA